MKIHGYQKFFPMEKEIVLKSVIRSEIVLYSSMRIRIPDLQKFNYNERSLVVYML